MKHVLLLCTISLLLTACYTPQRAQHQVIKAGIRYPEVAAGYCARTYPPKESTVIETEYLQGEPVILQDTLLHHDTLNRTLTRYITRTVHKTDTVIKLRTTQVVNTAALHTAVLKNEQLQQQLATAHRAIARKDQMKLVLWWAAGVLLLYTIARWLLKAYTRMSLP